MDAVAYTRGADVHFASGEYKPTTDRGQRVLGHELAHVVQQRTGRVVAPEGSGMPINAGPALESEADRLGDAAASGNRIEIHGSESSLVEGQPAPIQAMRRARVAPRKPYEPGRWKVDQHTRGQRREGTIYLKRTLQWGTSLWMIILAASQTSESSPENSVGILIAAHKARNGGSLPTHDSTREPTPS